jgi:hypothetical protein
LAGWIVDVLTNGEPLVDIAETALPEPTGDQEAVEAASAADREWFADNPGQDSYFRDALLGEWLTDKVGEPPAPGAVLVVEVRQYSHGLRTRTPAYWAFPDSPATGGSA